jgi:hypothetical protein
MEICYHVKCIEICKLRAAPFNSPKLRLTSRLANTLSVDCATLIGRSLIEVVHPVSHPSSDIYDYITIGLSGVRRGLGAEIIGLFGDKIGPSPGASKSSWSSFLNTTYYCNNYWLLLETG